MVDPDPAARKPLLEGWKAVAWVGGGCLVLVLCVLSLVGLLSYGSLVIGMSGGPERVLKTMKAHPEMPSWVPAYPGTHPSGWVLHGEGEVSLQSQDPPDRVLDFYAERLRASGFTVERWTEGTAIARLRGRSDDGREVTMRSGHGFGRTWIALGFKRRPS